MNKDQLLAILSLSENATAIYTGENILIETANDAMLAFWGKDRSVIGLPLAEAVPELVGQPFIGMLQEVWRTGITNSGDAIAAELLIGGKLQTSYYDYKYRALTGDDGRTYAILHTAANVTEKISALTSLMESEERFRTMAESSGILIAMSDETSNATYFSRAWVELTGRSMEDLLEFGWADLVHQDDRERYINIYLAAFAKQRPFTGELRVLSKNGDYRWLLATGPPRFKADGSFAGYISSSIDITERKKEEEEKQRLLNTIKDSEAKLDQVINQLPASITVLMGEDFVIERTNPANLAYWQKTAAEVVGMPLLVALPELAGQAFPGQLKYVLETGNTIIEEEHPVNLEGPDGKVNTTYVDYSYQPISDKDGNRVGVLVMSNDVSEKVESRRLLEQFAAEMQALNEETTVINEELTATNEDLTTTQIDLQKLLVELEISETKYRNEQLRLERFFMQAPAGICILDGEDLAFELINPLYQQLFPGRRILGKPMLEALPEVKGSAIWDILQEVYHTGKSFEGKELLIPLARTDDGPVEDRYFDFIYQARLNEQTVVDGILVFVIEVTEQVVTRQKIALAEENLRLAVQAGEMGTFSINTKTLILHTSPRVRELWGYQPDEDFSLEAIIGQIREDYRPQVASMVERAIVYGERFEMEYPIITHDDGKERWIKSVGSTIANSNAKDSYFAGTLLDISERRADDQRKNDFIGMVSHELKTPLTSLTAIVQVANNKLRNSEDKFLEGAMEKANLQVKKMNAMINGFLNVSRLESGKMQVIKKDFALDELIKEIIKEHELTVTTHIIELNLCEHIQVHADRDKIGSVITNLLSNAVKYSPKEKEINVTCRITENRVEVSIKDGGLGIRPQDIKHVFDRYFRVEANNTRHISGFGIGLYLSAEIIRQHDGEIWAESEIGKGSTFYFSLPM